MTAPEKMERNWILDAGTVQAPTFIRLWLPLGLAYSDVIHLSTTMLFEEIERLRKEEGIGMNEAIRRLFERYSETKIPIEYRIQFTSIPRDPWDQTNLKDSKEEQI